MAASTYQFGGHNSTKHYLNPKDWEVALEEWHWLGENWSSKAGWWEKSSGEGNIMHKDWRGKEQDTAEYNSLGGIPQQPGWVLNINAQAIHKPDQQGLIAKVIPNTESKRLPNSYVIPCRR